MTPPHGCDPRLGSPSDPAWRPSEPRPATACGRSSGRVWDSVGDYRMMKTFVDAYMKLWYAQKPTIAAVHGWCIAGGTDMVLCADMIVAAESASFGYPPSR